MRAPGKVMHEGGGLGGLVAPGGGSCSPWQICCSTSCAVCTENFPERVQLPAPSRVLWPCQDQTKSCEGLVVAASRPVCSTKSRGVSPVGMNVRMRSH